MMTGTEDARMSVLTALEYFEDSLPGEHTTVLGAFVGDNGQFSVWSVELNPRVVLEVIAALRTLADELEAKLKREVAGSA